LHSLLKNLFLVSVHALGGSNVADCPKGISDWSVLSQHPKPTISLFAPLIDKIRKKVLFSALAETSSVLSKKPIDYSKILSYEQISQLSETKMAIFFRMIDSILLQSLIVWPKKIEDKETLKKLQVSVLLFIFSFSLFISIELTVGKLRNVVIFTLHVSQVLVYLHRLLPF